MEDGRDFDGFTFADEAGGISHYRLDENGLNVLLVPLEMAPVVVFMITYGVGSRNESIGETGATHFLEHLMFKGSERFNRAAGTSIFNTLQRTGARVNATTWLDRTNYYEMLPDDELELAVEIEADRMRGALLSESDVASERTVILNELDRGENEPLRKLYQSVWSTAFQAHPYRHPTIGWRSDVEKISAEDLRNFYDRFYWPGNATVSVIGSFEPVRTMASVRRHFERVSPGPSDAHVLRTVEPPQRGVRRTTLRMAGEPPAVMIAFKVPSASDPVMPALSVLAVLLGRGQSSELFNVLVDSGLATAVSASVSYHLDPGLFHAYAMLAPGAALQDVETAILETLDRRAGSPIEPRDLERAKAQFRAETLFERDGPFAMASTLNEAIAAGDWRLFVRLPELVERTTADEVQAAARLTFERDRMTVGYFDPVREESALETAPDGEE